MHLYNLFVIVSYYLSYLSICVENSLGSSCGVRGGGEGLATLVVEGREGRWHYLPCCAGLSGKFFLVYKRFSGIFELGEIAYGNA